MVDIWQKRSCKSPEIMGLVRTLYLLAVTGNYYVHVGLAHIPGPDNSTTDHLSRLSMQAFHKLKPDANTLPTPIIHPPSSANL